MFVEEETSIASGVSFIRNRVDFVCLGESLPFLFHMMAVRTLGLAALWLLRHICPPLQEAVKSFLLSFWEEEPSIHKGYTGGFSCRSSTRVPGLHPNFLCFWRCSHLSHLQKQPLQNLISIFLPRPVGFQVTLLCCCFRKTSAVSSHPCC